MTGNLENFCKLNRAESIKKSSLVTWGFVQEDRFISGKDKIVAPPSPGGRPNSPRECCKKNIFTSRVVVVCLPSLLLAITIWSHLNKIVHGIFPHFKSFFTFYMRSKNQSLSLSLDNEKSII
jgi:hypothetical protein